MSHRSFVHLITGGSGDKKMAAAMAATILEGVQLSRITVLLQLANLAAISAMAQIHLLANFAIPFEG